MSRKNNKPMYSIRTIESGNLPDMRPNKENTRVDSNWLKGFVNRPFLSSLI